MTRHAHLKAFLPSVLLLSVPALLPTSLSAQVPVLPPLLEATKPMLSGEFSLYPGTPPGSAPASEPEQWNTMGGYSIARNVVVPTLTPVLPDAAKATGAAVVVVPGGAYLSLSMDTEGLLVARALAKQGVAAFVLKYRLDATPRDIPGYNVAMKERMGQIMHAPVGTPHIVRPQAVDDAAAAVRLLRAQSSKWTIDPHRLGMVGFSAGAMTTLTLTLEDRPGAMPDFIGLIYGPMVEVKVPANAPPLFAALAADDVLFGGQGFGLVESWHSAGHPVELHSYEHGNHGFGMRPLGTTSDLWLEQFVAWMRADKWLDSSKK